MTAITDPMGDLGLRFFGSTTASMSHELKNALAIIKENAGLLKDYMAMAEQGTPLMPERLKTVSGRIEDQVVRADGLIKALNRYAHTIDTPAVTVDLNEMLDILVAVSHRLAAMRQITLEKQPANAPVMVNTAPFFLLTAMGDCLAYVFEITEPGKIVIIEISSEKGGAVDFQFQPKAAESISVEYPSEHQSELLTLLNAVYEPEMKDGRIRIRMKTP